MPRKALAAIILLGLILRVVYAVAIYDPSFLNYNLDDFVSYRNAASDILHGDLAFTNSLYMKRPPLYALLVAALQIQPLVDYRGEHRARYSDNPFDLRSGAAISHFQATRADCRCHHSN